MGEREERIDVLAFEPGKAPSRWSILNELASFQGAVGGYIETLTLEEGVVLICNEEGRLKGLPFNRTVRGVPIVGRFLICGANEEGEFTSLPEETLKRYYAELREHRRNQSWPKRC